MNFRTLTQRMFLTMALALMATGVLAAPPLYRLHVDGLSCPFCAYGLEKKLGEVDGVQSLETNIKEGIVTVTMKDGTPLSETTAKQAIKAAGFSLRRLEPVQSAPAAQTK
ncbi:heavy-metal-associated domain-containing protein [Undibacterium griseum]|nr:heavy-metal-associated domain-containing protein [Undibacterium griseum]